MHSTHAGLSWKDEMTYKFFLGGADAEMRRIAEILAGAGVPFMDAGLGWGAKASAYGTQIAAAHSADFVPVLVELEVDCDLPEGTIVVDHHGVRSGEPASILQVLSLLSIKPTRWDTLIGAMDADWFPGLVALDATPQEMAAVCSAGRLAQGITAEQETEADRALAAPAEFIGSVRVIRMSHSKAGTIGERLAIAALAEDEPIPAYIVFSDDGEVNFSGRGDLAQALSNHFGGWTGGGGLGDAEGDAYWGGYPPHTEVEEFLRNWFDK
jgi:hypothetical protein